MHDQRVTTAVPHHSRPSPAQPSRQAARPPALPSIADRRRGEAQTWANPTPEPSGWEALPAPLWRPETRAFDGPRLRRAIVARGWTVPEFAKASRVHVASLYNALKGRRVRDATTIRIFETLEKREPMSVALALG